MPPGTMQNPDLFAGEIMKKILFVCTGNTCRSPMAEGIFTSLCKDRGLPYCCESAGLATCTGLPVSENSVEALGQMGIDISRYQSTSIGDIKAEDFDLFAVMTPEHREILRYYGVPLEKVYILNEDKGGINDPYGGSLPRYIQCAEEISRAVEDLIACLGEQDGN